MKTRSRYTFIFSLVLSLLAGLVFIQSGSAHVSKGVATVTFNKDVAPIFFKNCAECHRPGEIAPMSLMNYKEVRPWAKAIREKIVSREMPPWHADPKHGQWSNDKRMSQKEIDTITAWIDGGTKEGDPKDLPAAPKFAKGWQIGEPDVVFQMPEEFTVPAEGAVPYMYFTVPTKTLHCGITYEMKC